MSNITTNPFDDDHFHEECGVFGIFDHKDSAAHTALGLHALQHRGQEAAGIVSTVGRLDPDLGSLSGGKYKNPNVGAHPDRAGACVAWGDVQVIVRCVGLETP